MRGQLIYTTVNSFRIIMDFDLLFAITSAYISGYYQPIFFVRDFPVVKSGPIALKLIQFLVLFFSNYTNKYFFPELAEIIFISFFDFLSK